MFNKKFHRLSAFLQKLSMCVRMISLLTHKDVLQSLMFHTIPYMFSSPMNQLS